jgi:3-hydroxymyristoyl/3-hydroxydecanoyl-(acyl carrier protein) dehydratase
MGERHECTFTIAAEHPSLPGHFPGSPVVPGVVVLDSVMKHFEAWRRDGARVTGLRQVKFHAPLLPGEQAEVVLERDGASLNFRVTRGEQAVAQGTFTLAPGAHA